MECTETLGLLPAYVDQELSLSETIELDAHLQTCLACSQKLAAQNALRATLHNNATRYQAPHQLEASIRAALPLENKSQPRPVKHGLGWLGQIGWANLSTAVFSVVALSWSVGVYLATPSSDEMLIEDVISSHVRSLMVNHLADVASSDQHTVKPWFNGKLDFSPTVNDLTAQGFPLVGGRLEYLDHRSVAALVYRHRQHLINVYVWPVTGKQNKAMQTSSRQGYQLAHWAEGGMAYWVISDINARDLDILAKMLQAQGSPAPG